MNNPNLKRRLALNRQVSTCIALYVTTLLALEAVMNF
jgi:hypothetical protein